MGIKPGETTTIQISKDLSNKITGIAAKVAKREGLSRLSRPQIIEKMVKVFEDSIK